MIIAQWKDLGSLLVGKMNSSLILKAWNMNNIRSDVKWIRFDKLNELALEICELNNWNPDTTLMIYSPPRDNPNCELVSQETINNELKPGGYLSNKVCCMCCFYQNMNLEKMAKALNQIHNMKAFL